MNRRSFLSRAGLIVGGGLIAGPEVLDAFAQLPWKRRLFPGATFAGPYTATQILRDRRAVLNYLYRDINQMLFPICRNIEQITNGAIRLPPNDGSYSYPSTQPQPPIQNA